MKSTSEQTAQTSFPSRLNADHQVDPQQVVDDFFDYATLPQVKDILWRWLEVTVTGSFNHDLFQSQRRELLHFYQQLEKLVEATHLLHLAYQQKLSGQ